MARGGSLSAAARQLGVEHSTVARRIAALEGRIGVRLFDRLPRSWALTDEGQALFKSFLAGISPTTSKQLLAGMKKIRRNAEQNR